jgi:sortase A
MIRGLIRGTGEICITFGLLLLFFVAYELWGTGQYTNAQQSSLAKKLDEEWSKPSATGSKTATSTDEKIKFGDGIALMRVPRFGKGYKFVVVEGTGVADLRKGPGHYPKSAMPGQLGNFVISGHRTTYDAPFNKAAELRPGDKILIDTRQKQFIYQVTGHKIVRPSDIDVTDPVPFHPGQKPTEKLITLTTCHPKYSAAQRYIVFGELVSELPRVNAPDKKAA